jgi:hypothetical protein
MKKENKIGLGFDIKQQVKNQIEELSIIKYGLIAITAVGSLIALGYSFKLLNFTIFNYKNLINTLKL